jgi:hypothetical protein
MLFHPKSPLDLAYSMKMEYVDLPIVGTAYEPSRHHRSHEQARDKRHDRVRWLIAKHTAPKDEYANYEHTADLPRQTVVMKIRFVGRSVFG